MEQLRADRRKHPRFSVPKSEAVFVLPNGIISFFLIDISRHGLAFCYNGLDAENWRGSRCQLDFLGEDFSLESAPIQIITDQPYEVSRLPGVFKKGPALHLRRCGIRFLELSPDQEHSLGQYIEELSLLAEGGAAH